MREETIKFKSMEFLILALALLLFIGLGSCGGDDEAAQDNWKYVGDVLTEKGEYIPVYIDLKNMEIEGQIRKFWIRYYDYKDVEDKKEKYLRQVGFWEVDCQDRSLHVLGEMYYGPEGQVLGKTEERRKEEYKEGALGDKISSAACKYAGRD